MFVFYRLSQCWRPCYRHARDCWLHVSLHKHTLYHCLTTYHQQQWRQCINNIGSTFSLSFPSTSQHSPAAKQFWCTINPNHHSCVSRPFKENRASMKVSLFSINMKQETWPRWNNGDFLWISFKKYIRIGDRSPFILELTPIISSVQQCFTMPKVAPDRRELMLPQCTMQSFIAYAQLDLWCRSLPHHATPDLHLMGYIHGRDMALVILCSC